MQRKRKETLVEYSCFFFGKLSDSAPLRQINGKGGQDG